MEEAERSEVEKSEKELFLKLIPVKRHETHVNASRRDSPRARAQRPGVLSHENFTARNARKARRAIPRRPCRARKARETILA